MGKTMSWTEICNQELETGHNEASTAVRKAVALQRRTGLKKDDAIETVADLFQMSPRRVRSWAYEQIINPSIRECRLIVHRWSSARALEITRLRRIADQLEHEMERNRIAFAQLELPLRTGNETTPERINPGNADTLAFLRTNLDRMEHHTQRAKEAAARYRRARS